MEHLARKVHRIGPTAGAKPQKEMEQYCQDEIAHNTWEFEPSHISHMLSPKQLKDTIRPEDVKCFEDAEKYCEFSVDAPFFEPALQDAVKSLSSVIPIPDPDWPTTGVEKDYYRPLAKFLNQCIEHCNSALDNAQRSGMYNNVPESASRLYRNLRFVRYDTYMSDGIDGATPLKPDCGGGRDLNEGQKMCCGAAKGNDVSQMEILVEVKPLWADLLRQAAVYGRCLFSASPTRTWSLVIGFSNSHRTLRFLIFHRGGCTASKEMKLHSKPGQKEICRLILTMLLWAEDYHAGFCCFSTDEEYAIPDSQKNPTMKVQVQNNLHHMVAICTRGTLVSIVSKSYGAIGSTPPTLVPTTQTLRRSTRLASKPQSTNHPATSRPQTMTKRKSDREHSTTSQKKPRISSSRHQTDPSEPTVTGPIVPIAPGSSRTRSIARGIQVHNYKTGLLEKDLHLKYSSDTLLLKFCWPDDIQGSVEGELLSSTSGAFGTPSHIVSYTMREPSGLLVSNRTFLPSDENFQYAWWDVWERTKGYTAKRPNYRDATCHLFAALGYSLLDAPSSWLLLESISHALVGWLAYYQNGFLHRDVSIGNVLRLEPGLGMNAIDIKDPFSGQGETSLQKLEQTTKAIAIANTRSHIAEIKILVEKLGINSGCKGILIDGDMAAIGRLILTKAIPLTLYQVLVNSCP